MVFIYALFVKFLPGNLFLPFCGYLTVMRSILQTAEELISDIRNCALNDRQSQKKMYSSFYGYAMSICCRYTNRQDDAIEILNDGFLKVFKGIAGFRPAYDDVINSFKGWLKKIMVYTAIDYNRRHCHQRELARLDAGVIEMPASYSDALDKLSCDEIIQAVQNLPVAYRTVFNLFVIEGFSHEEIGALLGISAGTSKSNLFKAKRHLQKILFREHTAELVKNAI